MASVTENNHKPLHMRGMLLRLLMVGGLGCVLAVTVSCDTPRSRREWLALFFDGVPMPAEPGKTGPAKEPAKPGAGEAVAASEVPVVKAVPRTGIHPPYVDNNCSGCHAQDMSQGLKGKVIDVCFSCHSNFVSQAKVKHSPAEEGQCLECHAPHESPYRYLLVKRGMALCLQCHDDPTKGL